MLSGCLGELVVENRWYVSGWEGDLVVKSVGCEWVGGFVDRTGEKPCENLDAKK